MSKKTLTESDICDQFITPALEVAGWDKATQVRREHGFTDGKVMVRGKIALRGKRKCADYNDCVGGHHFPADGAHKMSSRPVS